MRLSLWIKFCVVFIGSIFLTGDLLSQNDTQSDSLNHKQNLYAIDIDGNGDLDALTDGLLILRGMFGLTGEALTSGAIGSNAIITDQADIESRINNLGTLLDVDDDGNVDALTDGLIILRYLFGLRDEPLVLGVISPDSQRSETSLIVNYLENLSAPLPEFSSSDFFEVEENQKEIGLISVNYSLDGPLTFSVSKDFLTISQDGMLSFADAPDYETRSLYEAVVTVSNGVIAATQNISISIIDVQEGMDTSIACEQFANYALQNEFRYCWEEDQTTSGTDYSANVISPLEVEFGDETIQIPDSNFAEQLILEYGIILSDGDVAWTNENAYAIHQVMKKIPQYVRSAEFDEREFSSWSLIDGPLVDDIEITNMNSSNNDRVVRISLSAFENATPRIASIEGRRGLYFSNRLHNALVRFVTEEGTDMTAVEKILTERFGVSINPPDYEALTSGTTVEQSSRFQAFHSEEILKIINMFEEMPSGFHKIQGLNYLIRRLDGAQHPLYAEAPAVAWPGSGYIEFMESGFNVFDVEYIHRLILHEKAHFLYSNVFDSDLLMSWADLGGWTHSSGDNLGNLQTNDGWVTSKQTEFVSAYGHGKNPNEDMAESISYFLVNPDALRSRALLKYEFIRDRIMQGDIYISQIQENLTFNVYNLYPDYVFPGKVNKIQISVSGEPEQEKTVQVEIRLHALDKVLEGAAWARVRVSSDAKTYFDLYLNPTDGSDLGVQLRGTKVLSKYAKSGYWQASNLVISDQSGNLRMERAGNDFGWRMYVNNPLEDVTKPKYIENSLNLSLTTREVEDRLVNVVLAKWQVEEDNPKENQGCYGALNDEIPSTYSIQRYSPQSYSGDYQPNACYVEYLMPYYMPSGTYRLNYIFQDDEAGNRSKNYFRIPDGVDGGQFTDTENQLDELAPELSLQTSSPDTLAPELDLNVISVSATPTNPDQPNGETLVEFNFRVRDDISGYRLGYYKFRDPQGLTSGYYHYPASGTLIFPTDFDNDWYDYQATVMLPVGSAPGRWGITELTLIDRAQNFKTYDFTEIVRFDVDE